MPRNRGKGTPIRIPLALALDCFSPGAIYQKGTAHSREDLQAMLKPFGITREKLMDRIGRGQYKVKARIDAP